MMKVHKFALAAACSLAVVALGAAAPAARAQAQAQALTYCRADLQRLCAGIQPGGGRLLKCLKGHENELSVGCAKGLMKMKSQMGK